MNNSFDIALIQMDSSEDESTNLDSIAELVEIASQKADFVILPEHANGVWTDNRNHAQNIPGDTTNFYSALAAKHKIYLHCGSIAETGPSGKPYNTSLVFDPEGKIIGKYRKTHLFDVDLPDGTGCRESSDTSEGENITVLKTELCNIGLSICYDLRFPELFRIHALNGAELLIVSANFTAPTGKLHWKPLLQTRAIENGCYIAAVNQCGLKPQFEAYGHTMLIGPDGVILGELDTKQDILYGHINTDLVKQARNMIPSIYNRRKDLYGNYE